MDDRWTGDWNAVEAWVTGLFPNLLHQLDEDEDEPQEWPYQVLVYVGSRSGTASSPVAQIDVSELEADDAAVHVAQGIEDVLRDQPDDRTAVVVKLAAVRQDDDGNEVPWTNVGSLTRSFTRPSATRSVLSSPPPLANSNMREVWESPRPPTVDGVPAVPPRTLNAAAGTLPMPGQPAHMVPQGVTSAHLPGGGLGTHTPFTVAPGGPSPGDQAMFFAFTNMSAMLNMAFSEHRFLVDQNAALMDRLLGVHETAIRSSGAEARAARQSLETMNRDMIALHRENIEATAETEKVRLEADKRTEARERQRVVDENKQLRETLEQTILAMQNQEEAGGDPNADPLRRKVVVAADQLLTQVLQSMSGDKGQGPPNAGGQGSQVDEAPAKQAPRRPLPRRPGLPRGSAAETAGAGAGAAAAAGGGVDLNNVNPQQAAMLLRLLDPKVRKETMRQLAMMDPTLLDQLRSEADDALDQEG